MPDVADPPTQPNAEIAQTIAEPSQTIRKPGFRFTPENARLMAAKSAQYRREHPFKFKPVAQAAPVAPLPQPSPPINQELAPLKLDTERFDLLNEQIKLTRTALNKPDLEPRDRAQLVRALCGLLDQLRIAKGEPLPGSRKPAAEKRERGPAAWESFTERPVAPVAPPPLAVTNVCQSTASVGPVVTPLTQFPTSGSVGPVEASPVPTL
jgi:hypothetical protein